MSLLGYQVICHHITALSSNHTNPKESDGGGYGDDGHGRHPAAAASWHVSGRIAAWDIGRSEQFGARSPGASPRLQ